MSPFLVWFVLILLVQKQPISVSLFSPILSRYIFQLPHSNPLLKILSTNESLLSVGWLLRNFRMGQVSEGCSFIFFEKGKSLFALRVTREEFKKKWLIQNWQNYQLKKSTQDCWFFFILIRLFLRIIRYPYEQLMP